MPKDRSPLRAGLLMVISLGLIVFVIISIQGLSWIKDPVDTHIVAFDLQTDIGGLRVGDEVRVGGYKVGEVKQISLEIPDRARDAQPRIIIAFTVPRRYAIREDAHIRMGGTVTGLSWLNFDHLGAGQRLQPGTPLRGLPSMTQEMLAGLAGLAPDIKAILSDVHTKTVPALNDALADFRSLTLPRVNQTIEKFGATADSLKQTGDSASALAADLRAAVKPMLERYNAVADKAVAMMETVRALFGDTTDDFRTTMANLRKATNAFSEKFPAMLDKATSALAKIDSSMDSVKKTLAELDAAVVNAKDLTAGAKAVVLGNKSKLDGMIDSVKKAGDNLKAATAEIRHSPWRLLYKPAPGEVSNLNLYDSARQFAEGATELNDAATALRDALKNGHSSEDDIRSLMQRVEKSFTNFKDVERKLWTDVKE